MKKSELRQDLVSGDWIVVAPERANRPDQFAHRKIKRVVAPKNSCPFENPQKTGHEKPVLIYGNSEWRLQVIANKYPTFRHRNQCAPIFKSGPFSVAETIGHHDVVITRDHKKNFSDLSRRDAEQVFESFWDRYLMLHEDQCVAYVAIFQNWGPTAGASVYHPHYQIIGLPIVPPDITHSLDGSLNFFHLRKKCVHCLTLQWELRYKKRIIYENAGAVAYAPFVSKTPFEIRIFPKRHLSYFENTLDHDMNYIVAALQRALQCYKENLGDPDYNFFIHTAPIKNKEKYPMYHWHIEVIPKITISAGFELGTGMDINVIDPDQAARILRKKN